VELNALQQEKSAVYKEAAAAAREWNRAVEAYLQEAELRDEADRMEKYTALSIRLVEEYMTRLQRRKTGVLGETITQCYRKLANKKDMIHKIEMDAETLDLRYLDAAGGLVAKDSLSAGEKQLMVIAILWALAICSRKKLPVIIDTPLARMDSMHRTALVTTYFPQASGQTIILSTDSEINRSYYALMQEYVGDEFTLVFDEQTQSTTISKGYFQTP
jgi:DNA sulfur modification protein DndD